MDDREGPDGSVEARSGAGPRRGLVLAARLYVAAVVAVSAAPTRELLEAGVGDRQTPVTIAAHFLEFLVLAVLVRLAAGEAGRRPAAASRLTLLVGIVVALATEMLQGVLPYRTFEVRDLVTNLLGLAAGLVLVSLLPREAKGAGGRRA